MGQAHLNDLAYFNLAYFILVRRATKFALYVHLLYIEV
jgi:hypothetical protein